MGFWDGSCISLTICKQSAPRSRQITAPTPHHLVLQAGCSSWLPTIVSKHRRPVLYREVVRWCKEVKLSYESARELPRKNEKEYDLRILKPIVYITWTEPYWSSKHMLCLLSSWNIHIARTGVSKLQCERSHWKLEYTCLELDSSPFYVLLEWGFKQSNAWWYASSGTMCTESFSLQS